MRNRAAWGLSAVLAVALLGGVGTCAVRYQRRAHVELLPVGEWRLGVEPYWTVLWENRLTGEGEWVVDGCRHCYGFFSLREEEKGTEDPLISIDSNTARSWTRSAQHP
jgi:hypothetical protein